MQKISTGHFLDTFGAFWVLLICRENPKMFCLKGFSVNGFATDDCSYQTMDDFNFPDSSHLSSSLQAIPFSLQ